MFAGPILVAPLWLAMTAAMLKSPLSSCAELPVSCGQTNDRANATCARDRGAKGRRGSSAPFEHAMRLQRQSTSVRTNQAQSMHCKPKRVDGDYCDHCTATKLGKRELTLKHPPRTRADIADPGPEGERSAHPIPKNAGSVPELCALQEALKQYALREHSAQHVFN